MRLHRTASLLFLVVHAGFALRPGLAGAQLNWTIQTADSTQGSGWTTSVRLSSTGLPRVAEWEPGAVRYASFDGSSWSEETVPPSSGPVAGPTPARELGGSLPAHTDLLITTATALALDTSDDPWIVSAVTDELHSNPQPIPMSVAHRAGGSWSVQDIASGFGTPSIEFDASERLHLCFDAGTPYSQSLEYGLRDAGVWSYEPIDANGSAGVLKLDGAGTPHIAYWDNARSVLVHAFRTSPGTWDTTTVPAPAGVGSYAIALGSDGHPEVAVTCGRGAPEHLLLYLERQPDGSWTTEVADSSAGNLGDVSLALNPSGDPAIAYSDQNAGLKAAFRSGGVWTSQVLEGGNTGHYTSIAMDRSGRPVVSYQSDLGSVDMRVAFGGSTLGVPPERTPAALRLVSLSPNPLHAGMPVALTLALPAEERVSLEAFDVSGRRVEALARRALAPGLATITWNVSLHSPGLYFVRASAGGWQAMAKLVVTR